MATVQELREQARVAITAGDHGRALSLLQSIRRQFPDDFETAGLLAQIDLEDGRHSQAREAYLAVLEVDPENVVARSALAMIAEEEGKLEESLEQFERAFDLDPSNHQIVGEIRRLHSRLGHTRPVDAGSSHHALARRLLRDKKYERAVSAFYGALRLAPEATEIWVGAARALWFCKRFGDAEEVARKILVDRPNCLVALAVLAGAAIFRRDRQFNTLLDRTAALNPGNPVAREFIEGVGLLYPRIGEKVQVPEEEKEETKAPVQEEAPQGAEGLSSPSRSAVVGALEAEFERGQPSGEPVSTPEMVQPDLSTPAATAVTPSPGDFVGGKMESLSQSPESEPAAEEGSAAGPPRAEDGPAETPTRTQGQEAGSEEWSEPCRPVELEREVEAVVQEAGAEALVEQRAGIQEQKANAQLHLSFGRSFQARGQKELALAEYRRALRLDPATAPAVAEAARAIVEADPANLKARRLVGDALVLQGWFRQAVEQYLAGMAVCREDLSAGDRWAQDKRSKPEE